MVITSNPRNSRSIFGWEWLWIKTLCDFYPSVFDFKLIDCLKSEIMHATLTPFFSGPAWQGSSSVDLSASLPGQAIEMNSDSLETIRLLVYLFWPQPSEAREGNPRRDRIVEDRYNPRCRVTNHFYINLSAQWLPKYRGGTGGGGILMNSTRD